MAFTISDTEKILLKIYTHTPVTEIARAVRSSQKQYVLIVIAEETKAAHRLRLTYELVIVLTRALSSWLV